jgi:hypothetical protein
MLRKLKRVLNLRRMALGVQTEGQVQNPVGLVDVRSGVKAELTVCGRRAGTLTGNHGGGMDVRD